MDTAILETMSRIRYELAPTVQTRGKCGTCNTNSARGGGPCLGCLTDKLTRHLTDNGVNGLTAARLADDFKRAQMLLSQTYSSIERAVDK